MTQQTSYHFKASISESKKINQANDSTEFNLPAKNFQIMPDIVELIRIMFGTITEENTRNMNPRERHVFYNITKEMLSFTNNLN